MQFVILVSFNVIICIRGYASATHGNTSGVKTCSGRRASKGDKRQRTGSGRPGDKGGPRVRDKVDGDSSSCRLHVLCRAYAGKQKVVNTL